MPIEHEMKYLYDITKHSISLYSEDMYCASWYTNIEQIVLCSILENKKSVIEYFHDYQLSAMRDLIQRGLWVKWSEKEGRVVLSPDLIYQLTCWDDSRPIPNGSD